MQGEAILSAAQVGIRRDRRGGRRLARRHRPRWPSAAGVRVLENPGNRGKGYSVRHGMLEAKGEWALFTDADLSAPIEELEKLWSAVESDGRAGRDRLARARPVADRRAPALLPRSHRAGFSTSRCALVTGLPFHDTQCGFKLFQTAAAREVFSRQQAGRLRLRRRGAVHRPAAGLSGAGSARALERRRGHEGEHDWSAVKAFLDPLKVRWNGIAGQDIE